MASFRLLLSSGLVSRLHEGSRGCAGAPAAGWNADLLWLLNQPEQGQRQALNRGKGRAERALLFCSDGIIRRNGEQLAGFSGGRWEEEDDEGAGGRAATWEWNVDEGEGTGPRPFLCLATR